MIAQRRARGFRADEKGATSIEFGMLALPFLMSILMVAQVGIESMKQAEINGAVQRLSEDLQATRFSPLPTDKTLREQLCRNLGDPRGCAESLTIELVPLKAAHAVKWAEPVNRIDLGADNDILLLRAQMSGSSLAKIATSWGQFHAARLVRRP